MGTSTYSDEFKRDAMPSSCVMLSFAVMRIVLSWCGAINLSHRRLLHFRESGRCKEA